MNLSTPFQEIDIDQSYSENQFPHIRKCSRTFIRDDGAIGLRLNINTTHHIYLNHHVFGNDAFVPATMIIELLFEAALLYCSTYLGLKSDRLKPAQIVNFDIQRALAIAPGKSLEADFMFKDVAANNSSVECGIDIVSKRISKAGKTIGTRLNTSSRVVLSYEHLQEPAISLPDEPFDSYLIPKGLYYEYFFPSLGPLFHSSCAHFALSKSKKYFLGQYDCQNKEENYITAQKSRFLTSPLGNDSCLQYAVFFSRIINLIGRLPIGASRLEFYNKHPKKGRVNVLVQCLSINNDVMVSNIYSFDSNQVYFIAKEFVVKKSPYHNLVDRNEFDRILNQHRTEESVI